MASDQALILARVGLRMPRKEAMIEEVIGDRMSSIAPSVDFTSLPSFIASSPTSSRHEDAAASMRSSTPSAPASPAAFFRASAMAAV
jgi:hypothetical protein